MKKVAGFLGVLILIACAPLAQAAIQISYSVNGATPAVICGSSSNSKGPINCGTVTVSGVKITQISANSNSPGDALGAQQFGSTLQITNTSDATLDIWIAAQDFTTPITPPSILFASNLTTDSTLGVGITSLTSCVDITNGLTPPTTPFCSGGTPLSNAVENYSGSSAQSNTVSTTINSLTGPYSLAQHITLALGAGSSLHVNTSAILTSVPEPSSVAFLGTMLLGAGAVLRKKLMNRA